MPLKTIAILIVATYGAVLASAADSESELKAQMEKFRQAGNEHNVAALDGLLADDYLLITRTGGINTKKEYLDRERAAKTPIFGKVEPLKTRVYGNTGIVTEKESVTGSNGAINVISTSVWMKDQGRWKLVSRQNTIVPATAP